MAGKTFLGRTPRSWLEIFLFYVFYYACIAAFFSATVGMYYSYMDVKVPSAIGDKNKLENQPGMGFSPKVSVESSFVYTDGSDAVVKKNKEILDEMLKGYQETKPDHMDECEPGKMREGDSKPCWLDPKPTCGGDENYGYDKGEPCVLIWLNNIYDFKPELYGCNDQHKGQNLNDYLGLDVDGGQDYCKDYKEKNLVPIICRGQTEGDRMNIKALAYDTGRGAGKIDLKYFPYKNQPGYLKPVVFVKLAVTRFVPVIITCEVVAKNIEVDLTHQKGYKGSVRFEVMVDIEETTATTG